MFYRRSNQVEDTIGVLEVYFTDFYNAPKHPVHMLSHASSNPDVLALDSLSRQTSIS